jgi:hypothetical protein
MPSPDKTTEQHQDERANDDEHQCNALRVGVGQAPQGEGSETDHSGRAEPEPPERLRTDPPAAHAAPT